MNNSAGLPSIYAYNDFRKFLTDYQAARQKIQPSFSKSEFSRSLLLPNTRSYLNDVLRGKKVSETFVERIITAVGLGKHESQFFRTLVRFNQANYRSRHFDAVCADAGLAGHTPKDLRDTFASQLLTAGIQLGYIAEQLGHADVATTARHYARWAGGKAYRRPLEVEPGEVPADLLERIDVMQGTGVTTASHLA